MPDPDTTQLFTHYQQPILFIVPAHANPLQTIENVIISATPYTQPSQDQSVVWINHELTGLGIDDVRALIAETTYATLAESDRIFVLLGFEQATPEAQNALLKLLESQTHHTQFWLATQQPSAVLQTVQSRCLIIRLMAAETQAESKEDSQAAALYQRISAANATECIKIAGEYKERAEALACVTQLLTWLTAQSDFVPTAKQLTALSTAHQQLTKGTNVKLALESAFFGLSRALEHFTLV